MAWNANNDTMHIVYEQDLQAGFPIKGEGMVTDNPIVYVRAVWMGSGSRRTARAAGMTGQLSVTPNPVSEPGDAQRRRIRLGGLVISDAAGRCVRELPLNGRAARCGLDGRKRGRNSSAGRESTSTSSQPAGTPCAENC